MNRAVIGIGSNIRPRDNIERALTTIGQRHRLLARSRFVETKPIGRKNQPKFINGVVLVETAMDRERLKRWLTAAEEALGRVRTTDKYGPRTIDLDIVVWNGEVVDADFYGRDFLRAAVVEVCPELDGVKRQPKPSPRG